MKTGERIRSAWMDARLKWIGFKKLIRELGFMKALVVAGAAELRLDPFHEYPEPEDEKEFLSRNQIRPALKLYMELQKVVPRERALDIVEKCLLDAGVMFMERTIGQIDVPAYCEMSPDERLAYLTGVSRSFFNAEAEVVDPQPTGFQYKVNHCRYVPLCLKAGVPELSPRFCSGDLAFFREGPLDVERLGTLAEGADCCTFIFRLKDEPESNPAKEKPTR